jgi:DNA-binding transcriptional ArsR family regulator
MWKLEPRRRGVAVKKQAKDDRSRAAGKAASGLKETAAKARKQAGALIDPDLAVVVKDPLRVQIVAIALQRPISPSEFAREFDCDVGIVSYHFRILRDKGFLELVEEIGVRGSVKHLYRATKRAYLSAADWGQLGDSLGDVSGAILQDLNARVAQAAEAGTLEARSDSALYWVALDLDEVSWPKFTEMLMRTIEGAKELEVETVERRAKGKSKEAVPATFAIAGFESPPKSGKKRKE